jgi:hypothetical protein
VWDGWRKQKNSIESFGFVGSRRIRKPSDDADSIGRPAVAAANRRHAITGASHALWTS